MKGRTFPKILASDEKATTTFLFEDNFMPDSNADEEEEETVQNQNGRKRGEEGIMGFPERRDSLQDFIDR